jgi:hypothetical protein
MNEAAITHVLRQHFRRQRAQALAAIKSGTPFPDFDAVAMAATLTPVMTPVFVRGARATARQLGRKVGNHVAGRIVGEGRTQSFAVARLGDVAGNEGRLPLATTKRIQSFAAWLFRKLFPRVAEAVQQMTLTFCRETCDTSKANLIDARQKFRDELNEGLEEGEANAKLAARVRSVFDTPRAMAIARTESNRAVSGGGLLAAKESGVVSGKTWLASREACPLCRALDGKTVPLDEPFIILSKGPPAYRIVMHPPYHPNCTCDNTHEIMERYL